MTTAKKISRLAALRDAVRLGTGVWFSSSKTSDMKKDYRIYFSWDASADSSAPVSAKSPAEAIAIARGWNYPGFKFSKIIRA